MTDQQIRNWTAAVKKSAKEVLASKQSTTAFLKKAGIVDKGGKQLAKAYR